MKYEYNSGGFSLIEPIIVAVIIVILSASAGRYLIIPRTSARTAQVVSDFGMLHHVLNQYKTDWGKYPVTGSKAVPFGYNTDLVSVTSILARELTGKNAIVNVTSNRNIYRENGGYSYFNPDLLITGMKNPLNPFYDYEYYSLDGNHFYLVCRYSLKGKVMYLMEGDLFSKKISNKKPVWFVKQ